jgi:hypothetical protein
VCSATEAGCCLPLPQCTALVYIHLPSWQVRPADESECAAPLVAALYVRALVGELLCCLGYCLVLQGVVQGH